MISDYINEHLLFWIFISVLIIAASYLAVFCFYDLFAGWREKRKESAKEKAKSILLRGVKSKKKSVSLPHQKNVPFILKCIHELDQELKGQADWKELRAEVAKRYLLPRARRMAKAHIRTFRLFATHCFAIAAETRDFPLIEKLIRDRHASIRLHAARAALALNESSLFKPIFATLGKERESLWWMYRKLSETRSRTVQSWIEKQLLEETNASMCAAYLYCLTEEDRGSFVEEEDLVSSESSLRKVAWEVYSSSAPKKHTSLIEKALNDPEPVVRKYAYRAAAYAKHSLLEEGLEDKLWDVQLFVAQLMKKSREGKKQLEKASSSRKTSVRDVATYALADPTKTS